MSRPLTRTFSKVRPLTQPAAHDTFWPLRRTFSARHVSTRQSSPPGRLPETVPCRLYKPPFRRHHRHTLLHLHTVHIVPAPTSSMSRGSSRLALRCDPWPPFCAQVYRCHLSPHTHSTPIRPFFIYPYSTIINTVDIINSPTYSLRLIQSSCRAPNRGETIPRHMVRRAGNRQVPVTLRTSSTLRAWFASRAHRHHPLCHYD